VAVILPNPIRTGAQELEHYAMVITSGADTLAVERVVRTETELRSEVLVPNRARLSVVASLGTGGCVSGAVVDVFPWGSEPDATPLQHVSVQADGDSIRVEARARDVVQQGARAFPGVEFVLAGDSYAASAMIVECALSRGDSVTLHVAAFPGLRAQDFLVQRQGDNVTISGDQISRAVLGPSGNPIRIEVGGSDAVVYRVAAEVLDETTFAAPDYAAPPGASYRAEAIWIPVKEGVTLAGTLTVPSGIAGPLPAVVLVSGGGPQDRDSYAPIGGGWRPFRELAHALSSQGVAALRFDDRGVGASTGDYGSSTEREGFEDVRAALAFLRAREDIAGAQLAVLGHSEGARVAMWVAAEDEELAGLVLMAGAADPRGAARAQALWLVEHSPGGEGLSRDSVLALVDRQLDSLAVSGSREVYRWDAPGLAQRIRIPVAVFQGATDRQVPREQADSLGALFRGAGNGDVTVRVFPDVNHLFVRDPSGDFLQYDRLESGELDSDVLETVVGWLLARLGMEETGSDRAIGPPS
jgi:pimeloyl-ACP methyl ester carboxylesterase